MKVTTPSGLNYDIRFMYDEYQHWTMAYITDLDNNCIVKSGMAHCNKKDRFVRKIGRKIALGLALQGMYPGPDGKLLRREIWETLVKRGMKLF